MVRVVGLMDGPGFFVWVGGWGFLDYGLLDKFVAKMLDVVNYDFRCCNDWGF